jgi:hypothetical protein
MAAPASNRLLILVPTAAIAERRGEILVTGADRSVRQFSGTSADLTRAVLSFLGSPRSRTDLEAHLVQLSGQPLEHPQVVDDLLKALLSAGVLQETAGPPGESRIAPPARSPARVVLGISGAIAAAHTPLMTGALLEHGYDVAVAATRTALTFVSRTALEALTHRPVYASLRSRDPTVPVPHLHLAEWAEVVVVCPATATTLSRIASGDCSDIVSAVVISTRAPVLIAPSMNPAMYGAPAVQRNLAVLRQDGLWLVDPAPGVEVALAPLARQPLLGAAPPPAALLPLVSALLALPR